MFCLGGEYTSYSVPYTDSPIGQPPVKWHGCPSEKTLIETVTTMTTTTVTIMMLMTNAD